jgi:hypothetical protein
VLKIRHYAKPQTVVRQCKKTADPQMAHLVFADTQPKAEKPKEPISQRSTGMFKKNLK